ncbi:MAG: hypothetical protein HKP24_04990 [Croceitalea sp.]|nr:hypothetical protein [Croceitalea sp.]
MVSAKHLVSGQKIGECHHLLQNWQSQLQFITDELAFIDKLLNSYGFEPQTPNLFERLELFKTKLAQSKQEKKELLKALVAQENMVDGSFECNDGKCDDAFCRSFNQLMDKITIYFANYQALKLDIYAYAGSILKKRKPAF